MTSPGDAVESKSPHSGGTADGVWIGHRLLHGGKGYAPTPMGGVHYRLVGPTDGPVLLLLHQTPWSMIQFGEVQDSLAEHGVRSLAIDTPGYGMSDAPDYFPTIADYANNLVPVLDHLGIDTVVVAGHHTGAAIAAAFAARSPERTLGLVMHGAPFYRADERAQRLAAKLRPQTMTEDGSHLADYFRLIRAHAGPGPQTMVTATWSVLCWFQAGISDIGHEVAFHNDLAADLAGIATPIIILSDAKDILHDNAQRAAQFCPQASYVQFSEGGAHGLMLEPARWAELLADFVTRVAQR
ncbi:MAG: alpha/beta hydrolase [Sphingomicrobium sp.]